MGIAQGIAIVKTIRLAGVSEAGASHGGVRIAIGIPIAIAIGIAL